MYELWFTDDPDPVATSNMSKLVCELDKLVEEDWKHRKYLEAYRSLLVRSLIMQVLEYKSWWLIIEYMYKAAVESGWRGMEHVTQYGSRAGVHSATIQHPSATGLVTTHNSTQY